MRSTFIKVLLANLLFCLIFSPTLLFAEIYKWTDKNGKVYFSDKKPSDVQDDTESVNLNLQKNLSDLVIPEVEVKTPIKNASKENSKVIILENISLEIEGLKIGENPIVGKAFKYKINYKKNINNGLPQFSSCLNDGDLNLNNAQYIFKQVDFQKSFAQSLSDSGYLTFNTTKKRFALQDSTDINLSFAAIVTDIKLAHCGSSNAQNIFEKTKNSTYLKVQWQIFDNLKRKVIFSIDTEGADNFYNKDFRERGALLSMNLAFQQALNNLLSHQEVANILIFNKDANNSNNENVDVFQPIDFDISYGNLNTTFLEQIEKIKGATATIRTTSGHGSGFVVSNSGHVITNSHVVSSSKEVIVIINEKEFQASILKIDRVRDVALLQLKIDSPIQALHISAKRSTLGESVFVIGTPLDESLSFSITKGIISAFRKFNENEYYQTDAAVNPGNSGGPVFNEFGNVIGITVSGVFTKDGGSKNINYLIPIADALSALGVL